jgi:hypothetical protein
MITFSTFANASTIAGIERIENTVKLFRSFFHFEELHELNLTLNFYRQLILDKPDARYIILTIDKNKEFGFGIFNKKEVICGKKICKQHSQVHEYLTIDAFQIKLIEFLQARTKKTTS